MCPALTRSIFIPKCTKYRLPKKLRRRVTLTTPTWGQFVITGLLTAGGKTPYSAVGKHRPHICIWWGPPTL